MAGAGGSAFVRTDSVVHPKVSPAGSYAPGFVRPVPKRRAPTRTIQQVLAEEEDEVNQLLEEAVTTGRVAVQRGNTVDLDFLDNLTEEDVNSLFEE
jgi:hypothetical protein